MKWVSDDGLVEVERPEGVGRRALWVTINGVTCLAKAWGPHWVSRGWVSGLDGHEDDPIADDYTVVVAADDELIVRLTKVRPLAAGTEADPRCLDREWRCARVIEETNP